MDQSTRRIFISSTTEDLSQYRAATADTVRQMGQEPVVLELAAASQQSPMEISRQAIESCDALVSIIAFRYGFIPANDNPQQHSFVEFELRTAWRRDIPTFVFMVADHTPRPPQFVDVDDAGARVRRFRQEVLERVVVGFFSSPDDLVRQVAVALSNWLETGQQERRADASRATRASAAPALPSSVDPFELGWRLVVDAKAEPAFLGHVEIGELQKATLEWAREALPNEPLEGSRLFETALSHLRSKQPSLVPSPLWLAWKRATLAGLQPAQSNGRDAV